MTTGVIITVITLLLVINISLMHTSFLIKLILDLLLLGALCVYWVIRLGYARKARQAQEKQ